MKDSGNKKKSRAEVAHKVSEKVAEPVAPLALGAQIKSLAIAHSEVAGKKNWLIEHSTDISIFLGFVWCVFRVVHFYYPDRTWTVWVRFVDVFLPATVMFVAVIYRLYPLIDVFFYTRGK